MSIKSVYKVTFFLMCFGGAGIALSAEIDASDDVRQDLVSCLAPAIDDFNNLTLKNPSRDIAKLLKSLGDVIDDHELAVAAANRSKFYTYSIDKAFEYTFGISERSRKIIERVTWDSNSQSDRDVFDSLRNCHLVFHSKLYFDRYFREDWESEESARQTREMALDMIDDAKTKRAMKSLGDKGGDFEKYSILKATGLVDRGGDKGPLDRQPKFFSKKSVDGKLKKKITGKDLSRISEKIRYLKGLTDSCECFQSDDDDGPKDFLAESYCKSVSDSNLNEIIADFEDLQSLALSEAQSQGVELLWGKKKPKLEDVENTELAAQIEVLNSSRGIRKDSANQLKNSLVRALIQYATFAENEKLMCAVKTMNPGKLEPQSWPI